MKDWKYIASSFDARSKALSQAEDLNLQLLVAAKRRQREVVKELLLKGADVNYFDKQTGANALSIAVRNDDVDLCGYLVTIGAKPSVSPEIEIDDAYWIAIKRRKYDLLNVFYAMCGFPKPKTMPIKVTPLIYAVACSDVELVRFMLEKGEDVNETGFNNNTPLHINLAKMERKPEDDEIARMLIAAGADKFSMNDEDISCELMEDGLTISVIKLKSQFDHLGVPKEIQDTYRENARPKQEIPSSAYKRSNNYRY